MQIFFRWEKQLRHTAKIKSAHFSTGIEGNTLTIEQVEKVLNNENLPGAPRRDVIEISNYFNVVDYIEKVVKNYKSLTHDIILKIHYLTIDNILEGTLKGQYRNQQNVITDSQTRLVVYLPPDYKEVYNLMDNLINFVNYKSEVHPVLKAGIAHYEFVRIHPFMDGNGRVARALTMLILYLNKYDIRKLFALEEYYEKDRQRYYGAIESVGKNNNDMTFWLEYFTAGMLFELERMKNEIDRLHKGSDKGIPTDLTLRQISMVSYVKKNGFVTNSILQKRFHITNKTVYNDVSSLLNKGILIKEGRGRSTKYKINETIMP